MFLLEFFGGFCAQLNNNNNEMCPKVEPWVRKLAHGPHDDIRDDDQIVCEHKRIQFQERTQKAAFQCDCCFGR